MTVYKRSLGNYLPPACLSDRPEQHLCQLTVPCSLHHVTVPSMTCSRWVGGRSLALPCPAATTSSSCARTGLPQMALLTTWPLLGY